MSTFIYLYHAKCCYCVHPLAFSTANEYTKLTYLANPDMNHTKHQSNNAIEPVMPCTLDSAFTSHRLPSLDRATICTTFNDFAQNDSLIALQPWQRRIAMSHISHVPVVDDMLTRPDCRHWQCCCSCCSRSSLIEAMERHSRHWLLDGGSSGRRTRAGVECGLALSCKEIMSFM